MNVNFFSTSSASSILLIYCQEFLHNRRESSVYSAIAIDISSCTFRWCISVCKSETFPWPPFCAPDWGSFLFLFFYKFITSVAIQCSSTRRQHTVIGTLSQCNISAIETHLTSIFSVPIILFKFSLFDFLEKQLFMCTQVWCNNLFLRMKCHRFMRL